MNPSDLENKDSARSTGTAMLSKPEIPNDVSIHILENAPLLENILADIDNVIDGGDDDDDDDADADVDIAI